jgi:HAE1 family hydrophobic/amphiphilic exporter-1
VALVLIVVFIFLQNWRATLIPLLTVPVSLVGAFIFFPLLGFSINVLSCSAGPRHRHRRRRRDCPGRAVMHHEHGLEPKERSGDRG